MRFLTRIFSALWHSFRELSAALDRSAVTMSIFMLIAMWVLLSLNTIGRWLGGSLSVPWSTEIVGYMIVWSIFMMMGPVAKKNEHIRMTFIPEKLLGQARADKYLKMAENLSGLGICSFLLAHAFSWVIYTKDLGLTVESAGGWFYPLWIVRIALAVGFFLLCIFYLERTVEWIKGSVFTKQKVGETVSCEAAAQELECVQAGADIKEGSARGESK